MNDDYYLPCSAVIVVVVIVVVFSGLGVVVNSGLGLAEVVVLSGLSVDAVTEDKSDEQ